MSRSRHGWVADYSAAICKQELLGQPFCVCLFDTVIATLSSAVNVHELVLAKVQTDEQINYVFIGLCDFGAVPTQYLQQAYGKRAQIASEGQSDKARHAAKSNAGHIRATSNATGER
jgi:hypothetical protein